MGGLQITTRNRSNLIDGGESPFTMEAAISGKNGVRLSSIWLPILARRPDRLEVAGHRSARTDLLGKERD
jgi:hypothetical protein